MNHDTERHLKQMAENRKREADKLAAAPDVADRAQSAYNSIPSLLSGLISDFNKNEHAKALGITLRLDGPVNKSYDSRYIIRLIGGNNWPKG